MVSAHPRSPVGSARRDTRIRKVIEALVARDRFDDAVSIADYGHPDLLALARISAGLARAGEQARAVELAERVAAHAGETLSLSGPRCSWQRPTRSGPPGAMAGPSHASARRL
jgi:hypothetical protein